MRKDKHKNKLARILSLALCMSLLLGIPAGISTAAYAAVGDPTLRFDLRTDSKTTGLKAGDRVDVEVTVSRQDGSDAAYDLYSVMLDIDYDTNLFELSNLKNAGLKRPDGANWTGSWNCAAIPAAGEEKRVRVLYTNISGLMVQPPVLDSLSGTLIAGRFTLTAKQNVELAGAATQVSFYYTECAGSDWKRGDSVEGNELTLQFANVAGGGSGTDSGSNSGSSSGSGSGGGADSGSGSGSGESGAGSNSGSGTSGGSGSGTTPGSGTTGGSNSGSGTGTSEGAISGISFSELTDVPQDHWAAGYIKYLVEKGIAAGNEKKQFEPEKPVTRAEFAQMIVSAFGYKFSATPSSTGSGSTASSSTISGVVFSDVTKEDWYYQPVMALYEAGVVSGMGDGLFGANDTLSRQDMAVILSRAMKDSNINLEMKREYGEFTDQSQVADYAQQALWNLYCTGIISGTTGTTLSPEAQTTRAQVATVLTNILQEEEGR